MLLYKNNLVVRGLAKASGSPIFYLLFSKLIRDFDAFVSAEARSHIFAPFVLTDFLGKCTLGNLFFEDDYHFSVH